MNDTSGLILVTGSNGRIGSAVMKRLTGKYGQVIGFDLKAPAPPPPECVRIAVDISSDESVKEGLKMLRAHHGSKIAAVIHLAAYYDFLGEANPKYDEITVKGTGRLLRGLQDGFEVEQFIFSSTMLVHAPNEPGALLTEDSPIGPTWAYPESKVRTEALIRAEHGKIPVAIMQLAGVYDDVCHSPPLANQIQRIYERQLASHLYSGETSHRQSFLHMDDLVDAIEAVVERRTELPTESTVLVGEAEALSYDELQKGFIKLIHGTSWETYSVPSTIAKVGAWAEGLLPGPGPFIKPWMIDRANDDYILDISHAQSLLGWTPKHGLRATMPKMVAALNADPAGWYREHGLELPTSMPADHATDEVETPGRITADAHGGHGHSDGGAHDRSVGTAAGLPDKTMGTVYTCPMHPDIRQSSPGNCPRCGMTLEPTASKTDTPVPAKAAAGLYTCPMHPEIVRDAPGSCPKCGMALVPKAAAAAGHPAGQGHEAMAGMPGMAGMATSEGSGDMMVADHRKMLWPHYLVMMLGLWLVTSPFTLGYMSNFAPDANQLRVMAERGLRSFELRNLLMTWSDVLSGLLVITFGALSANAWRRHPWAQWANAFIGVWLLFAPLVFWTPLPEAYANGTLVGAFVIALSVLIPMMPGMSMAGMMGGPDVPPGWAYTPSSWLQRMPIALLALVGFLISRVLGAYQLGHIDAVWDPFFAGSGAMKGVMNGTETIITSDVSKAWPIADGALGAIVYMAELVMIWMGGKTRWRTMPWMVLALAVLVLPLGAVSIYFIIIQPIVIGTWCALCLVAGLAMAVMIPYSLNEFVAMGQFMADAHRKGKPFWRTFWTGDAMEGGSEDKSKGLVASTGEKIAQATRGVTYPWTLLLSIVIGVWLTFTRVSFDTGGAMANSDHLIGALVVTFSLMALAEVGRAIRFINIPFGIWLIAAPWLLDGAASPLAAWNGVISGVLVVALAIPRGAIRNSYAGWNRFIV
ncbi:MAG: NAD-dependent epimerase/dehydratase family protein [Pseudomonadota bacterium]|nr:NAD-dependent epimerase/dehydratase family protein [Pseudomonadota bacterium]